MSKQPIPTILLEMWIAQTRFMLRVAEDRLVMHLTELEMYRTHEENAQEDGFTKKLRSTIKGTKLLLAYIEMLQTAERRSV